MALPQASIGCALGIHEACRRPASKQAKDAILQLELAIGNGDIAEGMELGLGYELIAQLYIAPTI